jgi:uncharacterized protein YggE
VHFENRAAARLAPAARLCEAIFLIAPGGSHHGNQEDTRRRRTAMRRRTPVLTAAALLALTGCGAAASASPHAAGSSNAVGPSAATTAAATTAAARAPTTTATITTTGTGTVSGTPNVMTVQIGVENTGAHVATALSSNNLTSAAVQAAFVHRGVALADIQTSQLSLYTQQQAHNVTRYQVTDEMTATLHDLSQAGSVIDAALAAAGDAGRLDGVSFSIADDSPLLAQARLQAVTAARTEAQQLAGAAGLKLVGLRSMSDQSQSGVYPQANLASGSAASAAAPVPVQPGTQQTTVQIVAVWNVSS